MPARSTRSNVSYASPKKPTKKVSHKNKNKINKRLLTSNTHSKATKQSAAHVETARNKVRADIAKVTKPKRDAYLLANRDYFQPLLPANNYIAKLERHNAQDAQAVEPEEVPFVALTSQPEDVKAMMKPYQLEGLSFLVHMYNNGISSILGDEMGLGKTLQTLALFQYLVENKPTTGEHRPNLVVCPLSVLSSWMAESKKWVPGLNVIRFHGPKTERERFKQECLEKKSRYDNPNKPTDDSDRIDLVVTTYETFTAEQNWFKRIFVWRYCVLDEGHKIKNEKSDISTALHSLSAEFRLLLTGTPLQNNLKEMWALLHWLFPEVFTLDTADSFGKAFDLTKGTVSTSFMDDARRLLELVMIRRMKTSPGVNLNLPPKEEVLLYVPLTPIQRFWYTRLLTKADNATLDDLFTDVKEKEAQALKLEEHDEELLRLEKAGAAVDQAEDVDTTDMWQESRAIIKETLEQTQNGDASGTKGGDNAWKKLMNLLMQLRKVCNHPYLLPNAAPSGGIYDIGDHVREASGKFIVLDKLLEELVIKQKKKVLIFSGFTKTLDLVEELLLLKGANSHDAAFRHARLDGSTARAQRNLSIRMFNNMDSEYKVMLLSTRAGGLGINLTSATDVVFMDEDWNPQVTLQAEARAHRIGQTKKVTIYKLCTQGTVEEQMMGRIRKKLYLSAKITESMRNLHSEDNQDKKRKRKSTTDGGAMDEEAPHLDTASLQSLIRRGAQTLARPEIPVSELVGWDWATTLENCKDKPVDALVADQHGDGKAEEVDEQKWLNSIEQVQTAVFDGKKHQKALEKKIAEATDLDRKDRRIGKNTTVEVDGFMISKESMGCADWEAIPTLAGKDPRLAEPKREKRKAIEHQDFCQTCWDGGDVVLCVGCPRTYHPGCLTKEARTKAQGMTFYCPQHECRDCGAKTTDAGGVIFRCRWCENGFCEDCLDWDTSKLIGHSLPEFEMLGFNRVTQAFYIECSHCVEHWKDHPMEKAEIEGQKERIQENYNAMMAAIEESAAVGGAAQADYTPDTQSEVATPKDGMTPKPKQQRSHKKASHKKAKIVA
jgi:SWI/SNF-related matrix-associated actin-dependent regulator of chromatin subfamily A member 5